jgi:peptide deformylase
MAVLPIRVLPDPVLKQRSRRIRSIDGSVQRLIGSMIETMHSAGGIGLAAPQVGTPLRVIVIGTPEEEDIVLINPEIVRRTGERLVDEGCLSIPGYVGQIKRAESVTVKGRDQNGKEIRIKANELLAQALEHEIDHLNGVLYIDHLDSLDKLRKIVPEDSQL